MYQNGNYLLLKSLKLFSHEIWVKEKFCDLHIVPLSCFSRNISIWNFNNFMNFMGNIEFANIYVFQVGFKLCCFWFTMCKRFMKVTFSLKKLLKNWFHGKFLSVIAFYRILPHCFDGIFVNHSGKLKWLNQNFVKSQNRFEIRWFHGILRKRGASE